MKQSPMPLLMGDVLEAEVELTLAQLSRLCDMSAEEVCLLVDEGIIEPLGRAGPAEMARWRFSGISLRRARRAVQLHRDLGVNWAGAALALDLLEELQGLRRRVERLEAR